MNILLIDNGKKPNEPINASLFFWLPPHTPYGNLQLKLIKVCQRIDEANRRIINSFNFWEEAKNNPFAYERHYFANEQAIYLIRKTSDEIISIIYCLNYWKNNNKNYPTKIKLDCIGAILKYNNENTLVPFRDNIDILKLLNEISNAFKHSFINSDITLIGKNEPCVQALALDHNDLSNQPEFYCVTLEKIILGFNKFYNDSIIWLNSFSVENR